MTEAGLTNSDTVDGSAWTRHRRTDIHGELEERGASRALKGISLNFDVLITRVITSSAERRSGNERCTTVESYLLTMSAQQERFQTYSWRVISRLKLAVMQLCTVYGHRPSAVTSVVSISEISKSSVSVITGRRLLNAARRPPMDTATIATRDISVSPVSPISEPVIDASPSLVLSILAVGRAETWRSITIWNFSPTGEHYHFTSFYLISPPFLSPLPSPLPSCKGRR